MFLCDWNEKKTRKKKSVCVFLDLIGLWWEVNFKSAIIAFTQTCIYHTERSKQLVFWHTHTHTHTQKAKSSYWPWNKAKAQTHILTQSNVQKKTWYLEKFKNDLWAHLPMTVATHMKTEEDVCFTENQWLSALHSVLMCIYLLVYSKQCVCVWVCSVYTCTCGHFKWPSLQLQTVFFPIFTHVYVNWDVLNFSSNVHSVENIILCRCNLLQLYIIWW